MQQFQYLDIFEQYTQNRLTAPEILQFKKRLVQDEAFAAEWLEYQLFFQAFEANSAPNKTELEALHQKLEQEGFFEATRKQVEAEIADQEVPSPVAIPMSAVKGGLWRRWAVAAGLVMVLVAGWVWQQSPTRQMAKLDQSELVRLGIPRGAKGILRNDTLTMVGNLISKKQYVEAEDLLSQFRGEKDEIYAYLDTYLKFEKGEIDAAIHSLHEIAQNAAFPSTQWDAEILLARCYIQKNDIASAKETLKKLLSITPDEAWESEYSVRQSIAIQYYNNISR